MDSNKCSTQLERLGVVETGRRRRWADDEKLKIVAESMETPRAISSTARRYGISRSLLLNWRRSRQPSTHFANCGDTRSINISLTYGNFSRKSVNMVAAGPTSLLA